MTTITLEQLEKEHNKILIDNKYGIGVTFLKAYKVYEEEKIHIPELSYHLHFYFSYDKNRDKLHLINLDDSSNDIIDSYSTMSHDQQNLKLNSMMYKLSKDFIDKLYINSIKNEKVTRETTFLKQPSELWDIFNEIKEQGFINAFNNLDFNTTNEIKPEESERNIDLANIRFNVSVEDRQVIDKQAA